MAVAFQSEIFNQPDLFDAGFSRPFFLADGDARNFHVHHYWLCVHEAVLLFSIPIRESVQSPGL
jgi:hypothetical protein